MRAGWLVAGLLAGCYSPPREAPCTLACTAATGCPSGLECNGATCTLPGGSCGASDGGVDAADAPGVACYGRTSGKGLLQLCFDTPPSGDVRFDDPATTMITTTSSPVGCTVAREAPNAPEVCVIAAERITIAAGSKIVGRGALPLVLLATGELRIEGELDVSARPGTGTASGSVPINTDVCPPGSPPVEQGGGAGGSFGARGGNGGESDVGVSMGGTPGAIATPSHVRGGCSGQPGQGAGNPGNAGPGGGAVYLIAGTLHVAASAIVNASGSGGGGAMNASGAGGGGSGGLIGVDVGGLDYFGGVLIANGGGGGCGVATGNNSPGKEPSPLSPQTGAQGCGGGGTGGAALEPAGRAGTNAPSGSLESGDGGGGGVGDIVFFGPTAPPVGAPTISPVPRHVP